MGRSDGDLDFDSKAAALVRTGLLGSAAYVGGLCLCPQWPASQPEAWQSKASSFLVVVELSSLLQPSIHHDARAAVLGCSASCCQARAGAATRSGPCTCSLLLWAPGGGMHCPPALVIPIAANMAAGALIRLCF